MMTLNKLLISFFDYYIVIYRKRWLCTKYISIRIEKEFYTPEEIAESNLRVALIGELIKARNEKGLTQRDLETLSGVKQPIIARIETGKSIPQVSTLIKLLVPLGKTLAIVPNK